MPGRNGDYILVVDDDKTIIRFIDIALSYEGLKCVGASNGEEATERVAEALPKLILLDLRMPVMDGREFCKWLHSEGYDDIPVVLMTASEDASRACIEMGAQGYLVKPFNLAQMQACVKTHIPA